MISKELKTNPFNIFTNHTMKNTNNIFWIIILMVSFSACSVNDSGEDENFFVVPFEIVVPVNDLGGGRYNVSSGLFSAKFSDRVNATSYTFVSVSEDGTKRNPITRRKNQLPIHNGIVEYGIVVGTPTFYFDVDEGTKDALIDLLTEELLPRKHQYKKVEVTVIE